MILQRIDISSTILKFVFICIKYIFFHTNIIPYVSVCVNICSAFCKKICASNSSRLNANSFFFEDGVVDVEPIKDANGTLTGLKQSSDADFKALTEKQEETKSELAAAGITGNSGSFELGDPNYRDDSLDAYATFGISFDKASDNWMYDGKIIHILYDADHNTYCDNSASDGINIKVIRDKNDNIEKLVETETQELERYVK